jgi:hypothetical protein
MEIRLDQQSPQNIYILGKLTDGSDKTLLKKLDQDFNEDWTLSLDQVPQTDAFAVTPDSQELYFAGSNPTLLLFNINAETGAVKGVFSETTIEIVSNHRIFPNPDSSGIYFTSNPSCF